MKNNIYGRPFAFVVMPFKSSFNDIYLLGIKAIAEDIGFKVERLDEQIFIEGMIERIYRQIELADVIIADLSEKNPNVFYEVGYAHGKNKICILLTKGAEDIPFDLKNRLHIIYNDISTLKRKLAEHLVWVKKTIDKNKHILLMNNFLKKIEDEFSISKDQINQLANIFKESINKHLVGHPKESTLRMMPSFFRKPAKDDKGIFIGLDFGSTNFQIMLVKLLGNGTKPEILASSTPVRFNKSRNSEELMSYIAEQIEYSINNEFKKFDIDKYLLGHVFSYPIVQQNINDGILLFWTKEITLPSDCEGKEINSLLSKALKKKNLSITPIALLNNTVSTFLAHSYYNDKVSLASICSRYGHNTCYYEKNHIQRQPPMIYNMESGNFYHSSLKPTKYDNLLDSNSSQPGQQRFEKMIGGQYIAEIIRLIVCDAINKGLLFIDFCPGPRSKIQTPYSLTIDQVKSFFEQDDRILLNFLKEIWDISEPSTDDCNFIRHISHHVIVRSARYIAASFFGTIRHIDENINNHHEIAVSGYLFDKKSFNYKYSNSKYNFIDIIMETLSQLENGGNIAISYISKGPAIGAAVAASIATADIKNQDIILGE